MLKLPPALVDHSASGSVREDVEAARGLTLEQRATVLESLCGLAAELTEQHPDPKKVLAWQDPVSKETEELLQRLRRKDG